MKQQKYRVFIALWPSDAARRQLLNLVESCGSRAGGRAVPGKNLHVTLVFLGNLESEKLGAVKDLLDSIKLEPFVLCLDQLGFWRRPQIVWAGCDKIPRQLIDYQKAIRDGLVSMGFHIDNRTYLAHVSLFKKARRNPGIEMSPVCWEVQRAYAVQSKSIPGGVEYLNL